MTDQSTAMKNRCVIFLEDADEGAFYVSKSGGYQFQPDWLRWVSRHIRVYGSHSEAKKQLPKWLVEFPDARILPAGEVV